MYLCPRYPTAAATAVNRPNFHRSSGASELSGMYDTCQSSRSHAEEGFKLEVLLTGNIAALPTWTCLLAPPPGTGSGTTRPSAAAATSPQAPMTDEWDNHRYCNEVEIRKARKSALSILSRAA